MEAERSRKRRHRTASSPEGPAQTGPGAGAMSAEELEFVRAVDEYKRRNDRPFPSLTEIFQILKGLGYRRTAR